MNTITGIVKKTKYTSGSPFGEQVWTLEVAGKDTIFCMWLSHYSSEFPKPGQTIEIRRIPDLTCGNMILSQCAELVKIIA
jgi:hypothetical protein